MKLHLDTQIADMKSHMMQSLMPLHQSTGGSLGEQLIKLDESSIKQYIDDVHKDKVKFDFDIHEFSQETVHVTSDGNKIEVHAKKLVKTGDEESTEEYSRTYELPTGVDVKNVKSCIEKGSNVLTIELPIENTTAL